VFLPVVQPGEGWGIVPECLGEGRRDHFFEVRLEDYGGCDPSVSISTEAPGTHAVQESRPSNWEKEIGCLYGDLQPSLYAYLITLGLVASEAEEVIQEGFFRLVRDLSAGNDVRNVRGWLFRVAHNLAMDVHRAMDRDRALDAEVGSLTLREQVDPDPGPEEVYFQKEKRKQVNTAIQTLTSQQRDCLLLRSKGMSYCEIGSTLDISTQRVAFLVQRSLARLADLCD
jgi:RNA polymerase sigma-70 factor, ECF subfamily